MSYITFSVYDETICKQFHLNALPVIITLLIHLKLVVLVRVLIDPESSYKATLTSIDELC